MKSYIIKKQAVSMIRDYSKYFFRYVLKERTTNTSVGPLIYSNGELTNNNFEICQLIQQQYLSVFSEKSDSNYISDIQNFFFTDNTIAGQTLESLPLKLDDVINAISQSNPNSALGPDRILFLL